MAQPSSFSKKNSLPKKVVLLFAFLSAFCISCFICILWLFISRSKLSYAKTTPTIDSCKNQPKSAPIPTEEEIGSKQEWALYASKDDQVSILNVYNSQVSPLTEGFTNIHLLGFHAGQQKWKLDNDMAIFNGELEGKIGVFLLQFDQVSPILLVQIPPNVTLGGISWSPSGRYIGVAFEYSLYSNLLYIVDLADKSTYQIGSEFKMVDSFAWSPVKDNLLIVGEANEGQKVVLYNPSASRTDFQQVPLNVRQIDHLVWSSDGKKIAFSGCGGYCGIYVLNLELNNMISFNTNDLGIITDISWSPNNNEIALWLGGNNQDYVYIFKVAGTLELDAIVGGPYAQENARIIWSAKGNRLAYVALEKIPTSFSDYRADLFAYDLESHQLWNVTCNIQTSVASSPNWTLDGQSILFANNDVIVKATYDGANIVDISSTGTDILWLPMKNYDIATIHSSMNENFSGFPTAFPSPIPSPTSEYDYHTSQVNRVIAFSSENAVHILDLTSHQEQVIPFDINVYNIGTIQWSHSGKYLAVSGWNDLLIGNYSQDGSIKFIPALSEPITSVSLISWSFDDKYLAYVKNDKNGIGVIDIKNQKQWFITDVKVDTNSSNSSSPAWSPDNRHLAFLADIPGISRGEFIYLANIDGTEAIKLTQTGDDFDPTWSQDGSHIFFVSGRNGIQWSLFEMMADGRDQKPLFNKSILGIQPSVSPDGSEIAYKSPSESTNSWALGLISSEGGKRSTIEVPNSAHETYFGLGDFIWAPDSKYILSYWGSNTRSELWTIDTQTNNINLVISGIEISGFTIK